MNSYTPSYSQLRNITFDEITNDNIYSEVHSMLHNIIVHSAPRKKAFFERKNLLLDTLREKTIRRSLGVKKNRKRITPRDMTMGTQILQVR